MSSLRTLPLAFASVVLEQLHVTVSVTVQNRWRSLAQTLSHTLTPVLVPLMSVMSNIQTVDKPPFNLVSRSYVVPTTSRCQCALHGSPAEAPALLYCSCFLLSLPVWCCLVVTGMLVMKHLGAEQTRLLPLAAQ